MKKDVRWIAAHALAQSGGPRSAPVLVEVAVEPHTSQSEPLAYSVTSDRRCDAMRLLGSLGGSEAITPLVETLAESSEAWRTELIAVLEAIAPSWAATPIWISSPERASPSHPTIGACRKS